MTKPVKSTPLKTKPIRNHSSTSSHSKPPITRVDTLIPPPTQNFLPQVTSTQSSLPPPHLPQSLPPPKLHQPQSQMSQQQQIQPFSSSSNINNNNYNQQILSQRRFEEQYLSQLNRSQQSSHIPPPTNNNNNNNISLTASLPPQQPSKPADLPRRSLPSDSSSSSLSSSSPTVSFLHTSSPSLARAFPLPPSSSIPLQTSQIHPLSHSTLSTSQQKVEFSISDLDSATINEVMKGNTSFHHIFCLLSINNIIRSEATEISGSIVCS